MAWGLRVPQAAREPAPRVRRGRPHPPCPSVRNDARHVRRPPSRDRIRDRGAGQGRRAPEVGGRACRTSARPTTSAAVCPWSGRGTPRPSSAKRPGCARSIPVPACWRRWRGYWSLSGPGWVQSALTLGAGSAGSSIFAGAVFGYDLLWVQPVAMFLGVVVFSAIGHQLLVTQARPYDVFRKKLHPALAFAWGGGRSPGLHHLAIPPIRPGHERRPRHLRRGRPRRPPGAHRPGPPRRRHGPLLELRAGEPPVRPPFRARPEVPRPPHVALFPSRRHQDGHRLQGPPPRVLRVPYPPRPRGPDHRPRRARARPSAST